jgi:hypothetical protein
MVNWKLVAFFIILKSLHTSAAEPPAWEDPSCGFKKNNIQEGPLELVKEYIKRDAKGEFLKASNWADAVILCVGHLGAPDSFKVITNYKILNFSNHGAFAKVVVRYNVLGIISSAGKGREILTSFKSQRETEDLAFVLTKTPYGWRIQDFDWGFQKVSLQSTLNNFPHKNWVAGEHENFNRVVSRFKISD